MSDIVEFISFLQELLEDLENIQDKWNYPVGPEILKVKVELSKWEAKIEQFESDYKKGKVNGSEQSG